MGKASSSLDTAFRHQSSTWRSTLKLVNILHTLKSLSHIYDNLIRVKMFPIPNGYLPNLNSYPTLSVFLGGCLQNLMINPGTIHQNLGGYEKRERSSRKEEGEAFQPLVELQRSESRAELSVAEARPLRLSRSCLETRMSGNKVEGMDAYSPKHQNRGHGRNENDFFHEFMHDEAGKLYSFLSFAHEHGQALSLSLDSLSSYNYKKQHALANTVSSSSVVDGDFMGDSSCSCAEHARHECVKCGGDGASSGYGSRSSNGNSCAMISIINSVQSSRYLKPAQQLLDEVVCVSKNMENELLSDDRMQGFDAMDMLSGGRSQFLVEEMNWLKGNERFVHLRKENPGVEIRMTKLFALLEELERHQQQYFNQMDALVTSFEDVAGCGAAAAYTTLTSNAMLKHFCNLKDSITSHINSLSKALYKNLSRSHGVASLHRLNQSSKPKRERLQCPGMVDVRQVFRPLRGLPEDSVAALRAWLFEHFLHP
ncbi:BEL1-like homeodomain protein 3 [Platanthera zijinensis]|uniref:BEL1-like homeodomain protein 3 n=1 Tax=Platanthera zijinensis TaxID=2320716 RepID=A0AAP0AYH9_9ASPA